MKKRIEVAKCSESAELAFHTLAYGDAAVHIW